MFVEEQHPGRRNDFIPRTHEKENPAVCSLNLVNVSRCLLSATLSEQGVGYSARVSVCLSLCVCVSVQELEETTVGVTLYGYVSK